MTYLKKKSNRELEKNMRKIILITGGQRSGKSSYAERLALELSPNPVYIATARVWDEEFRERVRRHQERRGQQWTNIEEDRALSRHDVTGRVVLVDCCTLWATNYFYDSACENDTFRDANDTFSNENDTFSNGNDTFIDVNATLSALKAEFDRFTSQDATFIFVTNEIGWGGTSTNAVQRRFTDLLGWLNQYIASKADEVVMMISGLNIKIK